MTTAELVLDQKFKDSYLQLERERKNFSTVGRIETVALVIFLVLFIYFVKFVFWGEGFSSFSTKQHDFIVAFLLDQPGPQAEYVEQSILEDGYISLMEYHRFVDMASRYKIAKLQSQH